MENLADTFNAQLLFDHPDPYPIFAMLRHTQPIAWVDMMRRPAFIVSKYDDCLTILKDADTFSSRANAEVGRFFGRTLVEMDGREHTRHRALVQQAFVPKAMDAIVPVMESLVAELLDAAARERRVDFVEGFTERFPVQVIAHIVGVPRADYARFQRWTIDLVGFVKDPDKGRAAAAALAEYLLPIVHARRAEPCDDVISRLVSGTVEGAGLTDDEVINFLRLLLPAGAETTFRLIGNMLFALLTERTLYERVRADRSLVGWAIEETLRWETSILFVGRESTRDTELRGVPIPAGKMVFALLASGNRDEDHYPDPDRFDLDRHADDHLSFGFGRHHCLGYHLARQEAAIALNALVDRLPNLRLDPDAPAPSITGLAFRSPKTLPVLLD